MDLKDMNVVNNDFMAMNVRPKICEIKARYEFMMPMRDGVKLHTVMFIPDVDGPYSLVFSRNPYLCDREMMEFQAELFCERGYAFAHQYCRGIGESEGDWAPFENEREDGIDAVHYLADLDFVENIGLYGFSYVGYAAWMTLDELPEKVKTAYIAHFGTNRYGQMYCNGLFRHDIYTPWAMWYSGSTLNPAYADSIRAGLYRPHINADKEIWGVELSWYRQWITEVNASSPYWKDSFWQHLRDIPSKVSIPICLQCGWYDHHFGGMMDGYNDLNKEAKKNCRLVIGPWIHEKTPCIEGYDVLDAFSEGAHSYADGIRWMDMILKNDIQDGKKIQAYMVGEGWKTYEVWPPKSTELRLYPSVNGGLHVAPEEDGKLSYEYNPEMYIKTHGAECMLFAPLEDRGSVKQEAIEREDALVFRSDVFEHGLEIAGNIEVDLEVATTAEDTAFVITLFEEKADGRLYNIRTSATTLLYRNDSEQELSYVPDSNVSCRLKMWDILWKMEPGARLVMRIASSSYPEYHIHTNTKGKGWAYDEMSVPATQTIFTGKNHTKVVVPVIMGKENENV